MKITIKSVAKSVNKKVLLHDIDCNFDSACSPVVSLLGPNGAGKSTLLHLISGIALPSSGTIHCNDASSQPYDEWARVNTVYVPAGDRGLRNKLTLEDNIRFLSALHGKKIRSSIQAARNICEYMGSTKLLTREFDTLSTGQKKLSVIVASCALNNNVLILDEPTNGLDVGTRKELIGLIEGFAKISNRLVLIASHDLEFLQIITNKAVFIRNGTIVGTINHPRNESITQEYYNLFEGRA